MRKIFCYLGIALMMVALTSCGGENTKNASFSDMNIKFIEAKDEDNILLVNRFEQKLFSYNTKTYQVEESMDIPDFMIYDFNPAYKYNTAGHSLKNGFSIIELNDTKVNVLYSMEANEGIFPLAFSDKYYFFIKTIYDSSSVEIDRKLVKYSTSENRLEEYKVPKGLISYGAIMKDTLFYTVYKEDENLYDLYSVSCLDISDSPVCIKNNLKAGEIFSQEHNLYMSDESNIFCENKRFKKESLNYFVAEKYLIQYKIEEKGDLTCIITDTQTNEIVAKAQNILDFSISDDEIIMYCAGAIERYNYR